MNERDHNNSGALFKNDHKKTERHPDYTGQAAVGGVPYRVSAWLKNTKDGKRYLSLAFTEKVSEEPAGDATPF